jgi:hypothetical protein
MVNSHTRWSFGLHLVVGESEKQQCSTALIRTVWISFILQTYDHLIHELRALRKELICAVSGCLIDIIIKFPTLPTVIRVPAVWKRKQLKWQEWWSMPRGVVTKMEINCPKRI